MSKPRTRAAVARLTEVYAEHMRFEDARETAATIVDGWSPERIAAYAGAPAAEAASRCWGRLTEALRAEGHRSGIVHAECLANPEGDR